jgi:hypothetical protein
MDLQPPPQTDDEKLNVWLRDLYRFLERPVFLGDSVSPRINYGEDAQASDAYVVSIDGITEYISGTVIMFKANTVNTGACTVNVNSLGAKSLKINGDTTDPANGWIKAGSIVLAVYDGTNFQILNPDMTP